MDRIYYARIPTLTSLSCGARIAFARQFRGMTQQKLGEAIGLKSDKVRNRVCRYEKGGRVPKTDRLERIAEVLGVSEGMLRNYDFREPTDFVYEALWIEEMFPAMNITLHKGTSLEYETCECFIPFYKEWRRMQISLQEGKITKRDYIEWKLTYVVPKERGNV